MPRIQSNTMGALRTVRVAFPIFAMMAVVPQLCACAHGILMSGSSSAPALRQRLRESCDLCEMYSFVFLFSTGRSGVRSTL
jgi:hypothetical protein